MRVLIVDDDYKFRQLISEILTCAGYDCIAPFDAFEERIWQNGRFTEFDVVITDFSSDPLRAIQCYPDTPVIVISVWSPYTKYLKKGIFAWLRKSEKMTVDKNELLATVKKAILSKPIKKLRNEERDVRKKAAFDLYNIADPASVPTLTEALNDEDDKARQHATKALSKLLGSTTRAGDPITKVLIVVNDVMLGELLQECLKRLGHERVQVALSSQEACEVIEAECFDWAIVNMTLPDIDGLQLLARIKKLDPGLPVVMMGGGYSTEYTIKAMRRGATDFLTKPFTLKDVALALQHVMKERALLLQNLSLQLEVLALKKQMAELNGPA